MADDASCKEHIAASSRAAQGAQTPLEDCTFLKWHQKDALKELALELNMTINVVLPYSLVLLYKTPAPFSRGHEGMSL